MHDASSPAPHSITILKFWLCQAIFVLYMSCFDSGMSRVGMGLSFVHRRGSQVLGWLVNDSFKSVLMSWKSAASSEELIHCLHRFKR